VWAAVYRILSPEQRRRAVVLLCLTIIGTVMEMAGLGLIVPVMAIIVDPALAARYPPAQAVIDFLGNPAPAQIAIGAMSTLLLVHVIRLSFLALLVREQVRFAFAQQLDMSHRLFRTYLRQPYVFHLQRNSAELIQNTLMEVGRFTFDVLLPITVMVTEGLVLIGFALLLVSIEPVGALGLATLLGAAGWSFHRFVRSTVDRNAAARQRHESLRLQHLQQGLSGVKDVILMGRQPEFLERFDAHNRSAASIAQFQLTLQQLPRLWLELLAVVGLAALVIFMAAQGREIAAVLPTLGVFAAAAFRLMPSANRLLSSIQTMRFGRPALKRIDRELALVDHGLAGRSAEVLPFDREIRLVDATFTYPTGTRPALDHISLVIRKGESIGFVGASGSGKSTLVDVLLGLLSLESGRLEVDGHDVQARLRDWQDRIGYVPQSIYLTDDTLRRNVAFGVADEAIDDRAVWRAIKAAQLEDLVTALPDKLDSVVGERGVRLSGGQRQRIGIARALYYDPPLLVLDEATSALDAATEREVMLAVNALHGTKTLLIVAHRLTTLESCDRVVTLDGGRLVHRPAPLEVHQS